MEIESLAVHFVTKRTFFGRPLEHLRAVDGIDLKIYPGQTMGLVGESGCGKTTTGRAILRLQPITAGTVRYRGQPVHSLTGAALRAWRRKVQIVFQDPYGSLNPRMTVGQALTEAMAIHAIGSDKADRLAKAAALLTDSSEAS